MDFTYNALTAMKQIFISLLVYTFTAPVIYIIGRIIARYVYQCVEKLSSWGSYLSCSTDTHWNYIISHQLIRILDGFLGTAIFTLPSGMIFILIAVLILVVNRYK
ncbi:hypothetical protein CAL7716_002410 [Calothrix sp. PCC 7716]|nr:hypothetical protein CAL7716_002410 [Calothrix sp. PCC 7716]